MNIDDITLLTCSFNENVLTGMMIKSFYKQYGRLPHEVVIVDNGNKTPVDDLAKKVFHVVDNFNHKLLPDEHQSSRNHSAAIDYAFKHVISTKWCLLVDNDILFKPSLKSFIDTFDESAYECAGEIGWDCTPPDRLYPYFCLINIARFKSDQLSYFDRERMIPIQYWTLGKEYNKYDTGYSFYEDIKSTWRINSIKLNDVCIHMKGAMLKNKDIYQWLDKNKALFI